MATRRALRLLQQGGTEACPPRVIVLSGAGISVAAGIPDFRSPGGMYSTLRPELLTATELQKRELAFEPTAIVSRDLFLENQFPYHEVRRPFILGTQRKKWRPTRFHRFVELLYQRGYLLRHYTQNIDGLDFLTGVPERFIIPCHGSIGRAGCEACGKAVDYEWYCEKVRTCIKDIYGIEEEGPKESINIHCPACGRPTVKPTTVLFGSPLPSEFFEAMDADLSRADIVLIAGTSLEVAPAYHVATDVPERTNRIILNREPVGERLGIDCSGDSEKDIFIEGDIEESVTELIKGLGWSKEMDKWESNELPTSVKLSPSGKKERMR